MTDRAVVFIDGSNFHHAMRSIGFSGSDLIDLDYRRLALKLAGKDRKLIGIRYYTGEVQRQGDVTRQAKQRKFLDRLRQDDVEIFPGRLEERSIEDKTSKALGNWLHSLRSRSIALDPVLYRELHGLRWREISAGVEKAADVMIATDLVFMAYENKYDAAYLLSADGDFTSVADKVRGLGKRIYGASPPRSPACDRSECFHSYAARILSQFPAHSIR